jgi:hypothetical protein
MFNILEPGARNKYESVVYREPVLFLGAAGESVWLDGLILGNEMLRKQGRGGGTETPWRLEAEAQKERGA